MRQTMQNKRAVLSFALVVVMALILTLGFKGVFDSANAQTKEPTSAKAMVEGNPAQQITLLPPPKDINELSMEVAALRTLYLLKAGPDQAPDHNAFPGFKDNSKKLCISSSGSVQATWLLHTENIASTCMDRQGLVESDRSSKPNRESVIKLHSRRLASAILL
jgi:hypothetical protein